MSVAGPVAAGVECPRCGEPHAIEARYCARCGLELATIPTAAAAAAAPTRWQDVVTPAPAAWTPDTAGRPASRAGWVAAIAGVVLFTSLAIGLVALDLATRAAAPGALPTWDASVTAPGTVRSGSTVTLSTSATNTSASTSELAWFVVETDAAEGATIEFVACVPRTCLYREATDGTIVAVRWPGLVTGERRALEVRFRVRGLQPGATLAYAVRTGVGPSEDELRGGRRWSLELKGL